MKKHYKTLGIEDGASQEEIQTAYERLSKELDPKNNANQEFFIEEYKKVQEAYKALSNSSILANKSVSIADTSITPSKEDKPTDNKREMIPNKLRKKIKIVLSVFGILFFVALGIFMFSGNQSKFSKLDDLVWESQTTRWIQTKISNDVVYVKNNMMPFSGNLSRILDSYNGSFLNGKKKGLHKEYSSGALVREGRFENGIPIGVHKNWYYNGQLRMEVTYSNGKREGLSKKWSQDGDLLSLDFQQNKILDYLTTYLNSTKTLNIIEGSYDDYDKNVKGYNFSVIKIFDRYYAIMTNNYRNGSNNDKPENESFYIGDVKAIFSSTQEINKYNGWYFMADKSKQPTKADYNIISNSLEFNANGFEPFIYFKK
jgi:curved DNA-binding protein CbpA